MIKLIICAYFVFGVLLSITLIEVVLWGAKNHGDEAPTCRKFYEELESYKSNGYFAIVPVLVLLLACMWPGWLLFILFVHDKN